MLELSCYRVIEKALVRLTDAQNLSMDVEHANEFTSRGGVKLVAVGSNLPSIAERQSYLFRHRDLIERSVELCLCRIISDRRGHKHTPERFADRQFDDGSSPCGKRTNRLVELPQAELRIANEQVRKRLESLDQVDRLPDRPAARNRLQHIRHSENDDRVSLSQFSRESHVAHRPRVFDACDQIARVEENEIVQRLKCSVVRLAPTRSNRRTKVCPPFLPSRGRLPRRVEPPGHLRGVDRYRRNRVERFRCDVSAVWPADRSASYEETFELAFIGKRTKDVAV